MRIVHVGAFKLGTVNGSYNALWSLACAQVINGDEVYIIRSGKEPSKDNVEEAEEYGVKLQGVVYKNKFSFWSDENKNFEKAIKHISPDIVNLQYVRLPRFFCYSRVLKKLNIPYVVSLHGGLDSVEMQRRKWRKLAYWYLIERLVHKHAAVIHCVTENERLDYKSNLSPLSTCGVVYNAVPEVKPLKKRVSAGDRIKIVYLGRYDIDCKGLDLILELIRGLGLKGILVELHLYGEAGKYQKEVDALFSEYSDITIIDHGYVGGNDKFEELAKYDFYIQYSRFELFGMSLIEGMQCGLPALVSEKCDLSEPLANEQAAIVLPMDVHEAVEVFCHYLRHPNNINKIAQNGVDWVNDNCSPSVVAKKMGQLYEKAINECDR